MFKDSIPWEKKLRKNTFDRVSYQATLKLQAVQFICGWVKKKILDLKAERNVPIWATIWI